MNDLIVRMSASVLVVVWTLFLIAAAWGCKRAFGKLVEAVHASRQERARRRLVRGLAQALKTPPTAAAVIDYLRSLSREIESDPKATERHEFFQREPFVGMLRKQERAFTTHDAASSFRALITELAHEIASDGAEKPWKRAFMLWPTDLAFYRSDRSVPPEQEFDHRRLILLLAAPPKPSEVLNWVLGLFACAGFVIFLCWAYAAWLAPFANGP